MYKPIDNNLIIRPIAKEKATKSGIILTNNDSDPMDTAEVIAVGCNINDIQIGDTIMFCPYAGNEIGQGLVKINYYDVLGVLD